MMYIIGIQMLSLLETNLWKNYQKNLESFLKTSPIFDGIEIIFSNSNVRRRRTQNFQLY